MPPTLFMTSNITNIENLLISYHFEYYGTFQGLTAGTSIIGHSEVLPLEQPPLNVVAVESINLQIPS